MTDLDDDRRLPKKSHMIGEDLTTLSEHELEERIALLEAEAGRIRETLAAKRSSRAAADSFFKR